MLSDGLAGEDVICRWKDFVKPGYVYDALNIFGRNVDSANGEEWQRHRKITASSLGERNVSKSVTNEMQIALADNVKEQYRMVRIATSSFPNASKMDCNLKAGGY